MNTPLKTLLLTCALAACDDGSSSPAIEVEPDAAQLTPDTEPTPEPTPDAAPPPAEDAAPDGAAGDAAPPTPDAEIIPPDGAPNPHLADPRGWVYLSDPITDQGEVTEVVLPESTDFYGRLTSDSVQVFNCLNEEGGLTANPFGGFEVALCHEVQVARPAEDGHYLHITPPEDDSTPGDSFAEIMMYYNVDRVHDYFKERHGFTGLDFPLPALVNLQFKITPAISLGGFMPGPDGWYAFPNAAFFPKESWDAFAGQLGLPPREHDQIIFGQADTDFSYDARVIFHEYTHAVIGTGRLNSRLADQYGLDDSPRAMNEGLADFFAGTLAGDAVIGRYGLGAIQANLVRDLAVPKRCPDDIATEVHADGKIIGSAAWAIREQVGPEVADAIVFRALEQFTPATGLQQAGELIAEEAQAVDPEIGGQVRAILLEFGVLDCVRAREFSNFVAERSPEGLPINVEGTDSAGLPGFDEFAPGFFQFYVDVPADSAGVTLSWAMQAGGGAIPGLGGAGIPSLDLALRRGEPNLLAYRGGVQLTTDAEIAVPEAEDGGGPSTQRITLSGSCLPEGGGRVYLMFLNRRSVAAAIVTMNREIHDAELPEDAPNVVDCAE